MRLRRGPAAILILAGVAASAIGPVGLSAASPSPAPTPVPSDGPPERPPFEVWLDRPLPADAQPGDDLEVGATVWDRLGEEIPRLGATIFLRALPADGAATPNQAIARTDWPGHFVGVVEVPASGLAGIELGVTGTSCENDACRPDDWVFEMAGVGPPSDAPISVLAEARIEVDGDVVAGTPTAISVALTPNADWASLTTPGAIVVRAREPRGPNVATATLPLADPAAMVYEGPITIPRSGDLVLEAATDEDGGDETRFATSMVQIAVGGGGDGGGAAEGQAPGEMAEEGMPAVVIVVLA